MTKRCYRFYFVAFLHFALDYYYDYYCWLRSLNRLSKIGTIISGRKKTYNGLHYVLNTCEIFCSEQVHITFGARWGTLLLIELFGFLFFITVFVSCFSPSFHFFFIFCRHLQFDFFIVRQISSLAQQVSSCRSKMMVVFGSYLSCSYTSCILLMSNKLYMQLN